MAIDPSRDVPLSPHCTLELGGPARYFAEAKGEAEVREALRWAELERVPVCVLGEGSNVVVADSGFPGLVLRPALRGIEVRRHDAQVELTVAAGERWDELVAETVHQGWAGFECLSGIPGLTGATPIQNVGAYGQEVSDTLCAVRVLSRTTLQIQEWPKERCQLAYRASLFKHKPDDYIVLAARFRLRAGGSPLLRYAELRHALAATKSAPSLLEVRNTVLSLRRGKSMLIEQGDPNRRSAGSFFTNPVVTETQADAIAAKAVKLGALAGTSQMPRFEAGRGRVKLAAAWLIERSGFHKGYREGAVGISSRHALALVHHGGGTTSELLTLARRIQGSVRSRFGVQLRPEPTLLGFARPPM